MTKTISSLVPKIYTRKINLIVIHCSASASGKKISTQKETAAQFIDRVHRQRNFRRTTSARQYFNPELTSIGYHFVIDADGQVFTGRSLDEAGAHALAYNRESIGICMVGGIERKGKYSAAQWVSLTELVRALSQLTRTPLAFAKNKSDGILGHRDLSADLNKNEIIEPHEWTKTCPSFSVEKWIDQGMNALVGNIYTGAIK